jgi:type III pantothenate kinase
MRLLVDAGNTRIKWQLRDRDAVVDSGAAVFEGEEWLDRLAPYKGRICCAAVSTVVSDAKRRQLEDRLALLSVADVRFYWSESVRDGLTNAYADVDKMGADRWHAMYACWLLRPGGFAVVDAGSAITLDYVDADGHHLGGYILPGKKMMLRSLQQDAARIGFDPADASASMPGKSTTECVQHGLIWLWEGLVSRLLSDCSHYGLDRIFCTGGDAAILLEAGLPAQRDPDLVLTGVAAIDSESIGP